MHELVLSPDAGCAGGRALADPEQCGAGFDSRDPRFSGLGSADQFTTLIRTGEGCDIFHPTPDSTPDPTLLCDVGDVTAEKRITLWGDSHANHWINALDQIGRDHHVKFTILSSGQCAAMDANEPLCSDRMAFIRDSGILDDSDAIMLSLWFRYGPDVERQPTQEALDVLANLTDTPVYLLQDIPPAGTDGGPDCDTRGLSCTNSVEAALSSMNGAYEQMVARGTLDPDRIIETSDMFCDATTCYSFIGGLPVYQSNALADDASAPEGNAHMTASYSLTLAELLAAKLDTKSLLTP
ncbi:SGNH hydrolase domain-containing protein [Leucobacter chironomi]|uniref:SGNH hydrolase domain-containing protein n=1 Tax=Leucobacter chironomi TaxID=491918 RepID=UPI00308439E9